MFTRFMLFAALTGALLSISLSPSRADTTSDIAALKAAVAALQKTVASQQAQINTLKSVTSGFSRVTDTARADKKKGTELYLTGFNLHVVNGLGATNGTPNDPGAAPHVNGLGNVIIGYNGSRGSDNDIHTGSHNLILGDEQDYASFGGIIAGEYNTLGGPYASVLGGYNNTVSAEGSTVSGGEDNTVSGGFSSILGGEENTVRGGENTVSGGFSNLASGDFACVGGGAGNTSGGYASTVSGGGDNTSGGAFATVGGGEYLLESNDSGFAAGGQYSAATPGPGTFHSP